MSFPEIGLCHAPENWDFGKISGWVFQDCPIRIKEFVEIGVTNLGDKMCCWQFDDIGDVFGQFDHHYQLSKEFTNIEILWPTFKYCHELKVTNIAMSPTSLSPWVWHESYRKTYFFFRAGVFENFSSEIKVRLSVV